MQFESMFWRSAIRKLLLAGGAVFLVAIGVDVYVANREWNGDLADRADEEWKREFQAHVARVASGEEHSDFPWWEHLSGRSWSTYAWEFRMYEGGNGPGRSGWHFARVFDTWDTSKQADTVPILVARPRTLGARIFVAVFVPDPDPIETATE